MKIKFLNIYNEEELFQIIKLDKNIFLSSAFSAQDIYRFVENPSTTVLCCLQDKEVVGYLIFSDNIDCFEVLHIACKEEFRKKGVATLLMKELICLKKDIFLEVRSGNENAINFYKKNNFNFISRRKHYYSDGEDALILKRDGGKDE